VVHPAAGHAQDTLVNALLAHSTDYSMKFGEQRPGIVHRLDKDTSGIMVVAKTDFVHEALALQFRDRSIKRHYLAVVSGVMNPNKGSVMSFLARHPKDRKRYSSVRDINKKIIRDFKLNSGVGKWAHTDYQVLGYHQAGMSYVKLKLQTGRTHQIRVHLAELGFPILGDQIYGNNNLNSKKVPRLALHASELGFLHPVKKEFLNFQKKWPNEFVEFITHYFGEIKE
jgi:23S rRNA pseudouridine1911/1915/1917 synthase